MFFNLFQASKSSDYNEIHKSHISQTSQLNSQEISNKEFPEEIDEKFLASAKGNQEIEIKSDKQSEINDVIYAEGNVEVSYKGKLFIADNYFIILRHQYAPPGRINLFR